MPHKGLGYGVLRYLADDRVPSDHGRVAGGADHLQLPRSVRPELRQRMRCSVRSMKPVGAAHDPHAPLPNELSVDSQVYGGELVLRWTFSAERHDPQTITELADAYLGELQSLIEHCLQRRCGRPDAVGLPAGETDPAATRCAASAGGGHRRRLPADADAGRHAAAHLAGTGHRPLLHAGSLPHQQRARPATFRPGLASGDRPSRSLARIVLLERRRRHAASDPQAGQHADRVSGLERRSPKPSKSRSCRRC